MAGCALASLLLEDRSASHVLGALPAHVHVRVAARLSALGEGAEKRRAVRALVESVRPVVKHDSLPGVRVVPGYAPEPALVHALRRIAARREMGDDSP